MDCTFIALAACAAVLIAPATVRAAEAASPKPAVAPPIAFSVRVLGNGLKVYSAVDRSSPNVSIQVWYGVGSKDDPQGRSGFAHLFEHMMFKATRDMPAEFMDRLTEDVGGENNASTWDDFTEYHETVPANHLRRLLWAEAERMSALVVDQANFASERDVVKEELRQRVLADPYGRLFNLAIPKASFAVHPYRRPGIGSIEELDAASLEDVRAFHAAYYRPDDAALFVVGDFDQAELDGWVDAYFGPLKRPDQPIRRVTAQEPPRTGPGLYDAYGPNVPLPAAVLTWLAPDKGAPDAAALKVAETILATGESSRLYRDLVHDQQLASQVFAEAELRQQLGLFVVGAVMAAGKTADQGAAALKAEVARLRDQPVSEAELDRAKNQLIAHALRERETAEGKAYALGMALMLEGDAARANDDIERLAAVTAEDVQRAARQRLADDRVMVIRYRDESEKPAGEAPEPAAAGASTSRPPLAISSGPVAAPVPEAERQTPPPPGPPVRPILPEPAERVLSNGLRVIVVKSSDLPLVTAELTVGAGGVQDPPGLAGLADMTATLLTKGAGARSAAEVAADVEALGGSLESGASWDGSQVTLNVLAGKLDAALPILADVVVRPTLAADELKRERAQALDALSVDLEEPGSVAGYVARIAAFDGRLYGHVLGGDPGSLKRIALKDVKAFHTRWYRPDEATLVMTGDIEPERGFALAEQAFGSWTKPAALTRAPAADAQLPPARRRLIVVDMPDSGQAAVAAAMRTIPRADPRYYPAIVANAVLGGGYSARLNKEIRIKRGLSYGAGSSVQASRRAGLFFARAQTKNEAAAEVVDLLLAEIDALRAAPPGDEELTARKASLTGSRGRDLQTSEGLAEVLSGYALQDIPLSELGRFEPAVEAVTPEAARDYAKTLDPAGATIVVVGDAKAFLPALKAKHPDVEVIEADKLDLGSASLAKPAS
jgi:zinc protease